ELAPLVTAGIGVVAPVCSSGGLAGLVIADEPIGGDEPAPADLELLRGLCEIAGMALQNGQRHRDQVDGMLDLLAERARAGRAPGAPDAEAAALADRTARACLLPARERGLLRHAIALGRWALAPEGRRALERIAALEGSGRTAELARLIADARD